MVAGSDAGPLVTDLSAPNSSGTLARVANGGVVLLPNSNLTTLVVDFDEQLDATPASGDPLSYAHSVLNPANWSLYCNGADITGAIANSISFTLNPKRTSTKRR